jgi:hypothetical protein
MRRSSLLQLIISVKRQSWLVLATLVSAPQSRITQDPNIVSGHDIAQDFSNHGIDVTMYVSSGSFICYLTNY